MNTQIELFRFNPHTDYLPYFKKNFVQLTPKMTFLELLNDLNKIENFGYVSDVDFAIKVNDKFIKLSEEISKINFDQVITIEPISQYRAVKDLLIDTKDFEEKFQPFAKFDTDGELRKYYNSFILEYYASKTLEIKKDFIGEASLMLAKKIILSNPEHKNEILDIISDEDNGIWFHTSLKNKILDASKNEECFEVLFELISGSKIEPKKFTFCEIGNVQDFSNFNIGYFGDELTYENLKQSNANLISLKSSFDDLAKHSKSKEFTLKIASDVLLEAIDNNCDLLVVEDQNDLEIFDKNQSKISAISKREINLPVISKKQFSMLSNGEKDRKILGFDNHKTKINFI